MHSTLTTKLASHDFITGMDIGGSKIHIADTLSTTTWRHATNDFPDIYALFDRYFAKMGKKPRVIVVAMAGPRDDDTGQIKLTNSKWPAFDPHEAQERHPETTFITINDMGATMAGVLEESSMNLQTLKAGAPTRTGTKLTITISTGIGVGAAAWDEYAKRYIILASEAGHAGFQPQSMEEAGYIEYLHRKHAHASFELAVAGKYGLDNLVNYYLERMPSPELAAAIERARQASRPTGGVLLEFASQGKGKTQEIAHSILDYLGAIIGDTLADLAISYKAGGGIYLTGSVSLALGEYLARNTQMLARFSRPRSVHSQWVDKIPLYLLTSPDIAVVGTLLLAKRAAATG